MASKRLALNIPDGWRFSDLQLSRHANGEIGVNLDVLRSLLAEPADLDWLMNGPEDRLGDVLAQLYAVSVERLGAEDPVMERLIAEAQQGADNA